VKPQRLTIVSRKYDGAFRFATEVELLHRSPALLLGLGGPGRVVRRPWGVSRAAGWSLEYLPLDRPYNIISFFAPDGSLRRHFCNALTAARVEGSVLSYVDLDLDVVVRPDGSHVVEDREQFERNARAMGYPSGVRALALDAVARLGALAEGGGHLFGCRTLEEARARLLQLYA
jgi:protein associated with RNAse G/E